MSKRTNELSFQLTCPTMAGRLANFAKQSSLLRSMINSNTILVKGDVPLPIEDEILQRIRQRSRNICQLIVPTQEAAQKLHRYLLSHVPNSVATSYRISTFENFVRHVYRSTQSKRKLISPELKSEIEPWVRTFLLDVFNLCDCPQWTLLPL